jgi:hypothetical protein
VVKLLVEDFGANVDARDDEDLIPLDYSVQ